MSRSPHATQPGHPRVVTKSVRLTEEENRIFSRRVVESGARSESDYLRRAALTGRNFEVPSMRKVRLLIYEIIQCRQDLAKHRLKSKSLEQTLKRIDAAMTAIREWKSR